MTFPAVACSGLALLEDGLRQLLGKLSLRSCRWATCACSARACLNPNPEALNPNSRLASAKLLARMGGGGLQSQSQERPPSPSDIIRGSAPSPDTKPPTQIPYIFEWEHVIFWVRDWERFGVEKGSMRAYKGLGVSGATAGFRD